MSSALSYSALAAVPFVALVSSRSHMFNLLRLAPVSLNSNKRDDNGGGGFTPFVDLSTPRFDVHAQVYLAHWTGRSAVFCCVVVRLYVCLPRR